MTNSNVSATATADFHEHALMGRIPVLSSDRVYTRWYTWVLQAFLYGAATWSLLAGGYLGTLLPPAQSFAAFTLGLATSLIFLSLFTGVVCSRYGIDTADAARPALGIHGAQVVRWLVFFIMSGTVVILCSLMAAAFREFAQSTLGMSNGTLFGSICAIVALALCVVVASIGPQLLERVGNWVIAPLFLMLLAALGIALINKYGFIELWHLTPDPELVPAGAYVRAVEFGFASGFGYWVTTGALYRLVSTPRLSIQGATLSWAYLIAPITFVGMFAALAVGSADPTTWMYELMGPIGGAVAMLFIVVANITALVVMLYIATVSMRQSKSLMRVPSWLTMVVIAIPAVIASFFADGVIANYAGIVSYFSLATSPIVTVLTVDYFLLRRGKIDLRHIFTSKKNTKYWYWGGVNPAAAVAIILGFAVYLWLFDPVTGRTIPAFDYLTASVPSVVVSGVVYWLLVVLVVRPAGLGAYPSAKNPKHVEVEENEIGF